MRRFAAIPAHPQKQYTRRWRLYLFCGFYYPIREVIPIAIYLVSECEMSHEDAQKQMDEVLSKGWTVQEIRQFFIDEYGIVGFQSVWNMSAYKKADAGEVQQYLDSVFQEESYTSYLGRKYADYLGITSILFTISVFAILLMRDMRKSIYSFIHTKPISSRN